MKYIKLFEDFDLSEIPQSEPQFTQWIIKNAPKSFTNPQEWFEEELVKPEPDWAYIGFIIKELGLANRLSIAKGAKEELERRGESKEFIDSLTLLHWSIEYNRPELAKMLIEAGADLDAKDSDKWTPLHLAAEYNHPELAKMLIEAGADVNAEDKNKRAPWDLANPQMREALPELNPNGDSL
jgi:hypothetical protein